MKKLLPFLLLPAFVMAQPPEGQQMPAPPSFDQFKETRLPLMEKSLPAMKETRDCVNKADSKDALEKCMNAMAEQAREIQKQSGIQEQAQARKMPDDFQWTPESKKAMLNSMDASIKLNSAMVECLSKSANKDEMGGCMREKLPAPKRVPAPAK